LVWLVLLLRFCRRLDGRSVGIWRGYQGGYVNVVCNGDGMNVMLVG
jgi:hypothetical protein